MTSEHKITLQANRLLGEFIGTLHGICYWDIPDQLKYKLQEQIKQLQNVKIGPDDYGKDVPTPVADTKSINSVKRKFDFWCQCIVYFRPKEYSYFKVCPYCDKRDKPRRS